MRCVCVEPAVSADPSPLAGVVPDDGHALDHGRPQALLHGVCDGHGPDVPHLARAGVRPAQGGREGGAKEKGYDDGRPLKDCSCVPLVCIIAAKEKTRQKALDAAKQGQEEEDEEQQEEDKKGGANRAAASSPSPKGGKASHKKKTK